jgi:hypothetical protein
MQMSGITLSAIVSGFPPELRSPRPLPGETMAELVIRNHRQEWLNLADRLRREFHVSEDVYSRLRAAQWHTAADPAVRREIEWWMNMRLPTHGRTLRGLAELRDDMRGPMGQIWQLELVDIIWPRQNDPSGNTDAEQLAESLGVIYAGAPQAGPLDIGSLLRYVHGDYLWILPGGTLLSPVTTMALLRVLRAFHDNGQLALYYDRGHSMIYRTAALQALLSASRTLSADLRENARMLQEAGFELAANDDPRVSLVELEPLYGGEGRGASGRRLAAGRRSPATQSSTWPRRRRRR